MGDMISKAINSFLEGIIKGALKWIINILTGTVKLLNTNMNEIACQWQYKNVGFWQLRNAAFWQ